MGGLCLGGQQPKRVKKQIIKAKPRSQLRRKHTESVKNMTRQQLTVNINRLLLGRDQIALISLTSEVRPRIQRYAYENRIQYLQAKDGEDLCRLIGSRTEKVVVVYVDEKIALKQIKEKWVWKNNKRFLVLLLDYPGSARDVQEAIDNLFVSEGIFVQGFDGEGLRLLQKYLKRVKNETTHEFSKIRYTGSSLLISSMTKMQVLGNFEPEFKIENLEAQISKQGMRFTEKDSANESCLVTISDTDYELHLMDRANRTISLLPNSVQIKAANNQHSERIIRVQGKFRVNQIYEKGILVDVKFTPL